VALKRLELVKLALQPKVKANAITPLKVIVVENQRVRAD
jgi:hypothetical protein